MTVKNPEVEKECISGGSNVTGKYDNDRIYH